MRALLKAVLFRIPQSVKEAIEAIVPDWLSRATARIIAPSAGAPRRVEAVKEPPRKEIGRLLFDAPWYIGQHSETPSDPDEAYRDYLMNGRMAGHRPSPLFADLRLPMRANLPQQHLFRVTASPILCRMPPTRYLELYRFREKRTVHRPSSTLAEYLRRAMIKPDLIGPDLTEYDLRVVAYMDGMKTGHAAEYVQVPQEDLISIILVVDSAELLADTFVSVLMQSYENWELIIANSGGGAQANAVIRQFDDARIRIIELDEGTTLGQARNACLERASGSLIAYLDSNSLWDPDFLSVLRNRMRATGARVSYGAQVIWEGFDADVRLGCAFKSIRFSPFNRSLIENLDYLSIAVLVHERSLLEQAGLFDTSLSRHVDWDWIMRATETARPEAVPCLLGHRFLPELKCNMAGAGQDESALDANDGDRAEETDLREARANFVARSEWLQPFTTTDGADHLAFSISRKTRDARKKKLAGLPVESVQILIPNYESLNELEICLASIAEHTISPYEVLVIDNGSSDETYIQLGSMIASFEHVRLVRETTAPGFSFAVNRGLTEIADKNEKTLILNNDTLVSPDWLDELRYVLFKHEDAGMAVPRQVLPAGARAGRLHMPATTPIFECDINLSSQHDNVLNPEFDEEDGIVELSFAPLFCGLLRPETLKVLGGLDSGNGPHYRSDWILCEAIQRVLKQRILYSPHSKVYHLQGVATGLRASAAQGLIKLEQVSGVASNL